MKWTLMPLSKRGVSKHEARSMCNYIRVTGHRPKVVQISKNRYKVYTSGGNRIDKI